MSPAEYVIQIFGGIRPLARVLGIAPSNIICWKKPNTICPDGGNIPARYHRALLAEAHNRNLALTPEQLIYGVE